MIHCTTKSCFNCQFSIATMYYFHTPQRISYFKNIREKRKLSEFNGAVENGVSSIPISMIWVKKKKGCGNLWVEGSYIYINESYVGHSGDGPRVRGEMKHRAGGICWEAGRRLLLGTENKACKISFAQEQGWISGCWGNWRDAEEVAGEKHEENEGQAGADSLQAGKDGLSWFRSMKGKRERETQRENRSSGDDGGGHGGGVWICGSRAHGQTRSSEKIPRESQRRRLNLTKGIIIIYLKRSSRYTKEKCQRWRKLGSSTQMNQSPMWWNSAQSQQACDYPSGGPRGRNWGEGRGGGDEKLFVVLEPLGGGEHP